MICNGFIRDLDGVWHCIEKLDTIAVVMMEKEYQDMGVYWKIEANWKFDDGKEFLIDIENNFTDPEEAQTRLDEMMSKSSVRI